MANHEELKKTSKQKLDELYTKYEIVRINARKLSRERQEKLNDHLAQLENARVDLENKWERVQHFGSETAEELSNAFSSSADAFSKSTDEIEEKMKD